MLGGAGAAMCQCATIGDVHAIKITSGSDSAAWRHASRPRRARREPHQGRPLRVRYDASEPRQPKLYGYVLGDPVNGGDPDGRYASLAGALLAPLASTAVVTAGLAMFVDLFGNVRPEATREGTARFGDGTLRGDCFRHCYGACLAAARYGGAAELIDYREPRGPSGQQDIYNNTAGRDICAEEGLEALDDHARAACGQGCEEAVASGALQCELL